MTKTGESRETKVLPFDIRYALKYREGKLLREDLVTLAVNGYEQIATALALKSLGEFGEKADFKNVLLRLIKQDYLKADDFNMFPEDRAVDGRKIALISRIGFDGWLKGFSDISERLDREDLVPFLLAHAPLSALSSFSDQHSQMGVLVPNWLEDETVGYLIEDDQVYDLPSDFERIRNAAIVDDVVRTGHHKQLVMDFWQKNPGTPTPNFVMLDDASKI